MRKSAIFVLSAAVSVCVVLGGGCANTAFPPVSEAHSAWRLDQQDEYYLVVRGGVQSRVLGLPSDELLQAFRVVVGQWSALEAFETSVGLVRFLRDSDLDPLAVAIERTISDPLLDEPEIGVDEAQQVNAVRMGLLGAWYELRDR